MVPDFNDVALVIIDVQEKLIPAMPSEVVEATVKNVAILAQLVAEMGGKVIYTEQYPKGLGGTVEALKPYLGDALRVEKTSFSCLGEERFVEEALPMIPDHLIVVGMETHVCVLQTIYDLIGDSVAEDLGRTIYVPIDAVCSRKKLHWKNALDQMVEVEVALTNTETLVFQALQEAGTPLFKKYSKLIR